MKCHILGVATYIVENGNLEIWDIKSKILISVFGNKANRVASCELKIVRITNKKLLIIIGPIKMPTIRLVKIKYGLKVLKWYILIGNIKTWAIKITRICLNFLFLIILWNNIMPNVPPNDNWNPTSKIQ